jgi:hypothetical protein
MSEHCLEILGSPLYIAIVTLVTAVLATVLSSIKENWKPHPFINVVIFIFLAVLAFIGTNASARLNQIKETKAKEEHNKEVYEQKLQINQLTDRLSLIQKCFQISPDATNCSGMVKLLSSNNSKAAKPVDYPPNYLFRGLSLTEQLNLLSTNAYQLATEIRQKSLDVTNLLKAQQKTQVQPGSGASLFQESINKAIQKTILNYSGPINDLLQTSIQLIPEANSEIDDSRRQVYAECSMSAFPPGDRCPKAIEKLASLIKISH